MNYLTAINWIALIAFYLTLIIFFYRNRKKVTKQWGIFFTYRTQRGLNFIRNLAKRFQKFWIVYGYVAIPACIIAMLTMLYLLVSALLQVVLFPKEAVPVAGIVLPGASTGVHGPIITVSIWYFLIAILVTLIVHEGAHALITAAHKMKLKSAGVGLLAIIPFAFVEPDEAQIEKSLPKKQMSIFAAGPFTNFLVAGILVLITFFCVLTPLANSTVIHGLTITELNEHSPAGLSTLKEGDIVTRIDQTSFTNIKPDKKIPLAPNYENALSLPKPQASVLYTKPGQTVEIETSDGKIVKLTAEVNKDDNTRGALGFQKLNFYKPNADSIKVKILAIIYSILEWIAIFNLGIGLFNVLPIGPVDGGRLAKTALASIFKKNGRGNKIFGFVSTVTLVVLLLGIFAPYIVKLF